MWKTRGFVASTSSEIGARRALILTTKDGRAMVNFGDSVSTASMADYAVVAVSPTERPIQDLSEAMAAAVRALLASEDT